MIERAAPLLLVSLVSLTACRAGPLASPDVTPEPPAVEPAVEMRVGQLDAPAFIDPARRSKLEAAFPAITSAIEERRQQNKLPGVALGIVIDGDLAYAHGFGYTDLEATRAVQPSTVFRIGSITKVFTALRTLQLRDAGQLSLDDAVAQTLPAFAGLVYASADARPITYADLLTHSSGLPRLGYLPYWEAGYAPSEAELLSSLDGFALVRAPGTGYEYSNLGFALLGLALARVSDMGSAPETLEAALLEPLGMRETGFDPTRYEPTQLARGHEYGDTGVLESIPDWTLGAMAGAGGLYSNIEDLARFVAWQLDAWPPRSEVEDPILARASSREAQTIHFATGGDTFGPRGVGWGWQRHHACYGAVVAHSGGTEGFKAQIAMLPERGVAVIALSNSKGAKTDAMSKRVLELLHETGALEPRRPPIDPLLSRVTTRLVAGLEHFDDALYTELAAPILQKELELEQMRGIFEWWHERLGACVLAEPVEVLAPARARYLLRCEAGEAELGVYAQVGQPRPLVGLSFQSRVVEPSAPVVEAAERVLALLGEWNTYGFEQSFTPKWSAAAIEDFFGRMRARHGPCELGEVLSVEGEHKATFSLFCSERPATLSLRVTDYGDGKIEGLSIRAPEREDPC